MRVGNIDTTEELLVIAEIGNNHEGDFSLATRMLQAAAKTGAQVVKFQTFITEHYISRDDPKRFAQIKSYELSQEQFRELARIAREEGVAFMSTPLDLESARFLNEIVPAFKIGSGENTFYPLLKTVAEFGKPIILSSGVADLGVIRKAIETIDAARASAGVTSETALLHCVTSYPTKPEDCNLGAMTSMRQVFPRHCVGYSDHALGIDAALCAVALGAEIIEKHFTLDKNYSSFRDHALSATPDELELFVRKAREIRSMLGTGEKIPRRCEQDIEPKVRRAICAARDLAEGTVLTLDDLCWTRPTGNGMTPGSEHLVIGGKLCRDIKAGERIIPELLS